ncbi:DUF4097 domain-containing protein [Anaerococcus sp. Marseille-Q5996]|uniref:DUF4097 domain-containing protein n=1 Tax=Anaerococcus sp. Marseille-Q5996 TaxID=2972769 RepID=UPI0021C9D422|nr:DUF4097 domain-containing protein [Anaerococcus sp. Marseille-Q5996]
MEDNNQKIKDEELYDPELEEILDEENKRPGKRKKRYKRLNPKKLLIALLLVILLAGALYYINKNQNTANKEIQTAESIDQNSYNGSTIMRVDLNQINKINIDLKTADVRIQRSNTNPYIEYTRLYRGDEDEYTIDVSYENGVLNLKSNIKGRELNMKNKVQILRIFLPMDKNLEEIKANIDAGDVKITDLEVRNLDLNVRSGHISFENSFFGGSVTNEAGDIKLDKSELLNTKLTTNAGDIIINESKLGNRSDFTTQTGDIIIGSQDSVDNYNVKANLEVGNFVLGNISYRNIKDGFSKNNKAQKDISLKTKVGDITFNKGEGAILEEEEYITNQTPTDDDEEDQTNTEEDENEDEPTEETDAEVSEENLEGETADPNQGNNN